MGHCEASSTDALGMAGDRRSFYLQNFAGLVMGATSLSVAIVHNLHGAAHSFFFRGMAPNTHLGGSAAPQAPGRTLRLASS